MARSPCSHSDITLVLWAPRRVSRCIKGRHQHSWTVEMHSWHRWHMVPWHSDPVTGSGFEKKEKESQTQGITSRRRHDLRGRKADPWWSWKNCQRSSYIVKVSPLWTIYVLASDYSRTTWSILDNCPARLSKGQGEAWRQEPVICEEHGPEFRIEFGGWEFITCHTSDFHRFPKTTGCRFKNDSTSC